MAAPLKKPTANKVPAPPRRGSIGAAAEPKTLRLPRGKQTQMAKVIEKATRWTGSRTAALIWARTERIPALDNRTAQDAVRSGDFKAVLFYLESIEGGAFA